MYGITATGRILQGECFTGEELVAVILTKGDDKLDLAEILKFSVFSRMTDAAGGALHFEKKDEATELIEALHEFCVQVLKTPGTMTKGEAKILPRLLDILATVYAKRKKKREGQEGDGASV